MQLEQFTEAAVERGGIDNAVTSAGGAKSEALIMRGKITLAKCKNL